MANELQLTFEGLGSSAELGKFDIRQFRTLAASNKISCQELLYGALQLSRLTDGKVPTSLRQHGFLTSMSSLFTSRRAFPAASLQKELVKQLDAFLEQCEEVPPTGVPIHQFNPALIPMIIQIIQIIMDLISKFKTA